MQPSDVVITQTAATYTANPVPGPNGGTIVGSYALQTNGSYYWTCSGAEPNNRCNAAINGYTSTQMSVDGTPQQTADMALRNAIVSIYNAMTVVPSSP